MNIQKIMANLINDAEKFAFDEINRQLVNREDICKCDDCVLDYAAVALNDIKPRYHVSMVSSVYPDEQYLNEIKAAVLKAIAAVAANPHHE